MRRQRPGPETAMIVYVTAPSRREARSIGRTLVEERLAACANVLGAIDSVYRWKGKVETAREALLILKTTTRLLKRVTTRIRELHSYDCPCVVSIPITGGNKPYLDWLAESVL
ncbi:MAG: divalent-cation tolerance protein CutA [Candidatus Peribacteraceae bacterium]